MRKFITLFITLLLIAGCQSNIGLTRPFNYRQTPAPTDADMCGSAQTHLTALCQANPVENDFCCMTVNPTAKGKSFAVFCEETENAGIQLNPKCLSAITKCEEINTCLGTTQ